MGVDLLQLPKIHNNTLPDKETWAPTLLAARCVDKIAEAPQVTPIDL